MFAARSDGRDESRSASLAASAPRRALKGFLAGDDSGATPVLDVPGLRCMAASLRMLLALKVLAHRVGEDEADVRLLAHQLGLRAASDVLTVARTSPATGSTALRGSSCHRVG